MPNSFTNRIDTLISFFDNRMNAILVREVRRLVRSNLITSTLILYISVLTFACLLAIGATTSFESSGEGLFASVTAIMGFFGFISVVAYTAGTTGMERANNDLMYITAIRPSSVVFGKFINALVMSFLLFSIALPFYTLAYQLRGINFFDAFYTVWIVLLNLMLATSFVILAFTGVKTTSQMYLVAFVLLFFGFPFMINIAGAIAMYRVFGGSGSPMSGIFGGGMPGLLLLGMTVNYAMVIAIFLSAAIANVSAPTSNKYMPVRITITICFFVSGITTYLMSPSMLSEVMLVWAGAMMCISLPLLIFSICDSDVYSFRLRRTIPQRRLWRLLVFPFYTGRLNGIVWTVGLFAIAFVVFLFSFSIAYSTSFGRFGTSFTTSVARIVTLVIFTFDYAITAIFLQRALKKNVPHTATWTLVGFLLAVFCVGGMLFHQFVFYNEGLRDFDTSPFAALNPFMILGDNDYPYQAFAAIAWFVVLIPFAVRWVSTIFRSFTSAVYVDKSKRANEESLYELDLGLDMNQVDIGGSNSPASYITSVPTAQTTVISPTPIYNDSNGDDASIKNS